MAAYGIDLGTTYSCIARVNEKGELEVIKNKEGKNITPSVVEFEEPTKIVVGEVAKGNAVINPDNTVQFIKRSMGDKEYYFYHQGEKFTPEQISSYILKKLVNDAQEATQDIIKDVVITVPAYFGFDERQATKNAGIIADLNVLEIINEPTAAAIAYSYSKEDQDKIILVYDLGGGTFDVTVAEITNGNVDVICTDGDHSLGGKDWDSDLATYITQQFCKETGVDENEFYSDAELQNDLIIKTEEAKKQLSSKEKAKVALRMGSNKASIEVTRELFDSITRSNLIRTIELTKAVINQASIKTSSKGVNCDKIDEIIFVGGSTRMTQVKEEIVKEFGIQPIVFEPDEAVAKGAAILAKKYESDRSSDSNEKLFLGGFKSSDVTSKSYGVEVYNKNTDESKISNIILKNTKIPCSITKTYCTLDKNQHSIDIQIYESNTVEEIIDLSFGNNVSDGELLLPKGLPKNAPIDVTCSMDSSGLLTLKAVEQSEKKECTIVVKTDGLTKEELNDITKRTSLTTVE